MKKRYALGSIAAVGLTFVLACITVNIYFPEATVKQAADEIVDEIRKKEDPKKERGIPHAITGPFPDLLRSRSSPPPSPRRRRTFRRRPSGPSKRP